MTAHSKIRNEQTTLYNAHYRRLYSTCLRITGNAMDAEEALHDTFLKIFDHLHKLSGNHSAFYPWSQRIAIHTAIDRVRKKRIYFEPVDHLAVPDEEAPDEEIPPLSVENIKQQLQALPDGYRIIVSMRLFEDMDFKEIASALHIKESTVRSQFLRGRRKLREALIQFQVSDSRFQDGDKRTVASANLKSGI